LILTERQAGDGRTAELRAKTVRDLRFSVSNTENLKFQLAASEESSAPQLRQNQLFAGMLNGAVQTLRQRMCGWLFQNICPDNPKTI